MRNQDRRYDRYMHDAKFHQAVKLMDNLISEHNFTHQDLQDAVFVAYMKFLERNPVPLAIIPQPIKAEKT